MGSPKQLLKGFSIGTPVRIIGPITGPNGAGIENPPRVSNTGVDFILHF